MSSPGVFVEYVAVITQLGLAALGFVLCALRWISRGLTRRWCRWEDSFFLAASLLTFLVYGLGWKFGLRGGRSTRGSRDTTGLPIGVSPPPALLTAKGAQWELTMQVMVVIILPLYKTSLLANYRRLFEPGPSMRVIYGVLGFVGVASLVAFIVAFARCSPLSAFVNGTITNQCAPNSALGLLIPEMLTSFVVIGLPLVYIQRVQWRGSTITCAVFMALFALYTLVVICGYVAAAATTTDEEDTYYLYYDGQDSILFGYMMLCCVPNLHALCSGRARAAGRAPKVRLETSPGGDLVPLKPLNRTNSEEA